MFPLVFPPRHFQSEQLFPTGRLEDSGESLHEIPDIHAPVVWILAISTFSAAQESQETLQDYFDRPAITGRDDRGCAMG